MSEINQPPAKISIILPTFNEKENIIELIKSIHENVKGEKEILVVDDNSPDGTWRLVEELIAEKSIPNVRLLRRMHDKGLTKSIWDGIQNATGDIVVWMDCDFSMPPEDIPKLLQKVAEGYDIVAGSRFVKGGSFKQNTSGTEDSWIAVILSRLMNEYIRLMLGRWFKDYTSGFVAVKKNVFKKITLTGDYGEYFIDFIVRAKLLDYKIIEIPYICLPRTKGYSKTGSGMKDYLKRGKKYLAVTIKLVIVKIRYRFFRVI